MIRIRKKNPIFLQRRKSLGSFELVAKQFGDLYIEKHIAELIFCSIQ
jgi:hypothetical protein